MIFGGDSLRFMEKRFRSDDRCLISGGGEGGAWTGSGGGFGDGIGDGMGVYVCGLSVNSASSSTSEDDR